jgi:hypothetical protein
VGLGEFYLDSHITKLSPIFWVKGTIHPKTGSFSPGLGFTVIISTHNRMTIKVGLILGSTRIHTNTIARWVTANLSQTSGEIDTTIGACNFKFFLNT